MPYVPAQEASGQPGRPVVAVCSWQRHFHHSTFNAALLQIIACAFPGHHVHYYADETQLPHVEEVLGLTEPDIRPSLSLHGLRLGHPRTIGGTLARMTALLRMVRLMTNCDVDYFVFADLGEPMIRVLRRLIVTLGITIPVIVIAHGLFEPLGSGASVEDIRALRVTSPANLRFVVLGHHIQAALRSQEVEARHDVRVLPHPAVILREMNTAAASRCTFAFPGVPDKGLLRFTELAARVKHEVPSTAFLSAGFTSSEAERNAAENILDAVADRPLAAGEYLRQLGGATFGVWFSMHQPDPYLYRASGTIPDLIACGKPGHYLANDMVRDYFQRFGPIGAQYETWDALTTGVLRAAQSHPYAVQNEWLDNLARARRELSPSSLASTFRDIVLTPKGAA